MTTMLRLQALGAGSALLALRAWLALASPRPRDERGDVPGWVLITVVMRA